MIKFVGAFDKVETLPGDNMPEYAFIGRSNVGKSSLLNSLVGQKIARTSNTPGRTQMINLFGWDNVMLADLPGYGYARASKTDIAHWRTRLEKYLCRRQQLERVFILVDSRHGIKDSDRELMEFCDRNAIGYQVVLTKLDKIKKPAVEKVKADTESKIANNAAAHPVVIATSSEKKTGIDELKAIIKNMA